MEQNDSCGNLCSCRKSSAWTSPLLHALLLSIIFTAKPALSTLIWLGSFGFFVFRNILHFCKITTGSLWGRNACGNKLFWNVTFVYTSASFAIWDISCESKRKRATLTAPWDEKVPLFQNSAPKTNNYILDCLYLLNDWAVQVDRNGQIN